VYVTNWEIKEQEDTVEVSADVDGFRLSYRLPRSYQVSRAGDPFLAAALLPAMLQGEKLDIDPSLPVSPKLLENIFMLQEIHHCWNPVFKVIPINVTTAPAEPLNPGSFSFFSGGVDSMYTFLKRMEEISHLVFIHGFDFYLDKDTYRRAIERNTSFARGFDKVLIPVETNHYPFGYRYNLSRNLTQGSALASVALLVGFPRVYLPAAYSYSQLIPLGSHPLTDRLWSNEAVEIIHDGAETRRVDKVKKIAECESALDNLRVCFDDINVNCGKCAKCMRTSIPLTLLRVSVAPFPPLLPLKAIRKMRIDGDIEMIFFKETFDLALRTGDEKLRDALRACMQRYERVRLLKELDRVFLGGLIKRAYRRISRDRPVVRRIDTTPPGD
jgi:hypothetical protein